MDDETTCGDQRIDRQPFAISEEPKSTGDPKAVDTIPNRVYEPPSNRPCHPSGILNENVASWQNVAQIPRQTPSGFTNAALRAIQECTTSEIPPILMSRICRTLRGLIMYTTNHFALSSLPRPNLRRTVYASQSRFSFHRQSNIVKN